MLVKFRNDSDQFEEKVDILKSRFNVGAASKVAEICVNERIKIDDRLQKALEEIERLEDKLSIIRDAIATRDIAERDIIEALRE